MIEAAHRADVNRLLFLGSSCIYPKLAPQPITEDALLTGPLEPTNECLCGGQDRRHQARPSLSQAIRARLHLGDADQSLWSGRQLRPRQRPCAARAHPQGSRGAANEGIAEMTIWGSGTPRREFLHVDDCADALVLLLKAYSAMRARQRRLRRGSHHPRTRRTRGEGGRVCRAHDHRPVEAGWHAAKTDERRAPRGARMAAENRVGGGRPVDLRMVFGEFDKSEFI